MDKEEKLLIETHDAVLKIQTFLLGTPNTKDTGFCGEFYRHLSDYEEHKREDKKFRMAVYILFGLLVGSGVISVSVLNFL